MPKDRSSGIRSFLGVVSGILRRGGMEGLEELAYRRRQRSGALADRSTLQHDSNTTRHAHSPKSSPT